MATLIATAGAPNANSYETLAEALLYFEMRTTVAGWENADDQELLLMMGTRVLDAMARPLTQFVPATNGQAAYFITRRTWTGSVATATQKLAWPRVGMFDGNGRSLDWAISNISIAAASVITTSTPHLRTTGDKVFIFGSNSTPTVDGERVVTVLTPTTFSVPVTVSTEGTQGSITIIPQDLKDALAELAGQLGNADLTLDNDIIVQGIKSVKAGSVALSFKDMIATHVIPDMVWSLMPPSWFTVEVITPAWPAEFDVVSS